MVLKSDCFLEIKKTIQLHYQLKSTSKMYHYSMHYVQLSQRETR